ncbi:MAG: hypothetical protein F6K48_01625 [Okeania sp. SIO3H1]|nr:hypothetical protein [Okeania sp. SIO3H1]
MIMLWTSYSVFEPTFRTTKCSIESGVRRQPTPRPSPSQEGKTGDRILEENHSCRD